MKKIISLSCYLFLHIALFADNRINADIKEVTVYLNGAKLQSKANVALAAGNSEVIFENLSPYIYSQSLQVKLDGKAKLLSAKFRTHYIEGEHQEAKIQHLQDSLSILMDIESDLNDEIYSYEQEERLLNEVYNKMINSSSDWVKALSPIAMNDFKQFPEEYSQKLRKIKDKLRELGRKKKKIQKENIGIQNRIRNLAPKDAKTTGEIVLQLNSATAQSIDITCIYLITAASWNPLYDISSEGTDKPVHLTYKAGVRQTSGFDWKNVQLKFSTSNPFVNNSRPILNPVYVDYNLDEDEEEIYRDNDKTYNLYDKLAMDSTMVNGAVFEKNREDAGYLAQNLIDGQTETNANSDVFVELEVEEKHDIPSTGEEQIIEVESFDIPAIYQYHAVPKKEASVFLLAKITNYGQYNLMPGTANIFYQTTLIGQSQIDPKTVADTMFLSFGRDENISIQRIRAVDMTSSKIIGANKKEILAFDIIIKNNRSVPINIEIIDQIPISRNSEIEVSLEEAIGAEYVKDYGRLLWRLAIPANQNKKVRFSYVIKHPKDKEITLTYDISHRENNKIWNIYTK